MYGIGRGRAIGHFLKGALPDPRGFPMTSPCWGTAMRSRRRRGGLMPSRSVLVIRNQIPSLINCDDSLDRQPASGLATG